LDRVQSFEGGLKFIGGRLDAAVERATGDLDGGDGSEALGESGHGGQNAL